jgi:glycolate oxidase FAD binding subunit
MSRRDTRDAAPESVDDVAEVLRSSNEDGAPVRFSGGKTKMGWGNPVEGREISSTRLAAIVEHNHGDLTAVVEAGVPLVQAQSAFAEHNQIFPVDPPLGDGAATVGGIVATGDSGPLRHRYGAVRDLILGMTVVLGDGTVAKSGGRVIKNVAGYDLAKLFAGSFGSLGFIARVALRLYPRPPAEITVRVSSNAPGDLAAAAATVAHLPLEMDCLDVRWDSGSGAVLARFAGAAPGARAEAARRALGDGGFDSESIEDDGGIWAEQRAAQRSESGVVLRVSCLPSELASILTVAHRFEGRVTGRAGLGILYVALAGEDQDLVGAIEEMRADLHPRSCVVLDAPEDVRGKVGVWGEVEPGLLTLTRRVKDGFDPAGICNRGIFLGGM